jgi:ABC-type multidrug transport system fused ATPase/permease subunit
MIMSQTRVRGDGLGREQPVTADEVVRLREENEALRGRLSRRRTVRTWLSHGLVVLTVIALIASMVAIWARETLYDTDRFLEVVQPALDDPAFYAALSDRVADESLEALELDTRVAAVLGQADAYLSEVLIDAIDPDPRVLARVQALDRPALSALAPPIVSALEGQVAAIVDRFITSEEFQARFPELVEQVHTGGVALIRGDMASLPNVYTDGGEVRLDLVPVITEALQQVATEIEEFLPEVTLPVPVAGAVEQGREQLRAQLGEALDTQLPEDFGQVTLMSESALAEVQQTARQADQLVWVMAILALLLLGLSIAVSPDRRRSIIALALGVVAGLVITMLAVRRLETALLEQIVNADGRQAVAQAYGELASNLRTIAVLVAVGAIVISIVAYLAGRPARITDLGQRWTRSTTATAEGSDLDRWVAARFELLRLAGIALALVIVFLIGLELLAVLTIGALLGLYLWTITAARQRTNPDQPTTPDNALGSEESPPVETYGTTETGAEGGETDPERLAGHPLG